MTCMYKLLLYFFQTPFIGSVKIKKQQKSKKIESNREPEVKTDQKR